MLCVLRVTIDKKRLIKVYVSACTNNHTVSITYLAIHNSKDIASKALFLYYEVCFRLNGKIDIINRSIFNVALFKALCKRSR